MLSNNVKWETRPAVLNGAAQSLASPVSFTIDLEGQTWLQLDVAYVHSSATSLNFTFTGDSYLSGNQFKHCGVNYSGSSSTAGVFSVALPVSATDNFKIPFSLTGVGLTGKVVCTITAGGASNGTVAIQPYVGSVGA